MQTCTMRVRKSEHGSTTTVGTQKLHPCDLWHVVWELVAYSMSMFYSVLSPQQRTTNVTYLSISLGLCLGDQFSGKCQFVLVNIYHPNIHSTRRTFHCHGTSNSRTGTGNYRGTSFLEDWACRCHDATLTICAMFFSTGKLLTRTTTTVSFCVLWWWVGVTLY